MNAKSVQFDMEYEQWIITCPNTRLIRKAEQTVAATTRIEAVGTMQRCQIWNLGSKVHASLSATDGNVTSPTFLSYLRSLSLPAIGYEKIIRKKNIQQESLFTFVHFCLLDFCYCWFIVQNVRLVKQIWQKRIISSTSVATAVAYRALDCYLSVQGTVVSP